MNNLKSAKRIIYCLVIGWLLIRFVLAFFINHISLFEVHDVASTMLQTGEMKYFLNGQWNYNYQFPIYPTFLWALYSVLGISPKLAIILNCIFHSISVISAFYFFYAITHWLKYRSIHQYAPQIALLASLALLIHPSINYYIIFMVHPFALDLCLMMLSLWLMAKYFKTPSTKSFCLYAICFGVAVLNRTSMVVLIFPFFIYYVNKENWFSGIKKVILALSIAFIISLPWLYRNYSIYNAITINSSFGQNLWLGVQEQTGGSAYLVNGENYYRLLPEGEWRKINELKPMEQSDYFVNKYLQTLNENPSLVLKMFVIKMRNFWWFRQGIGIEYPSRIRRLLPIYQIAYAITLILAIVCMLSLRKEILYVAGFILALSLFQSLFYVETRHRIIIEPILIWMALITLYNWLSYRKKVKE